FNSYVLMLQPPFRMLGMMIMMGQRASASARRIYEILDTPSDIVDAPDALETPLRGDLAFVDVSFAYPNGTSAIDGLNLHVRPGGYETGVGERGYTLSGGQRQRIAIARALIVNPPILILDDATSAIDVTVEQRIHHSLREQMRGRTTLIVAHRLSTISLADRV